MTKKNIEERLVLRKYDRVGSNGAEEDKNFLAHCFVDTGELALLADCKRPERIVIGRTGTGKTALLMKLVEKERSVEIKPENLALSFISNSTILRFFEELGVNLEPFYKLIWRHALAVELLRMRFGLEPGEEVTLMAKIRALLRGGQYSSALSYLERWHDKFWQETEIRIKELTQKVEQSLKGSLTDMPLPAPLSAELAKTLATETKSEITRRAQKVVNDAHVPQLNQIVDVVQGVLDDPKKVYYIVIDRLDESWVDDRLRYKLVMALLETVKDFRRVDHAKIIVSLRIDLLHRVFANARPAGFQEEKFQSLYLRLRWTREDLIRLLDERINHLFQDRYSKRRVLSHNDLLVPSKHQRDPLEYIIDRTLMRPRDLIAFFNQCLEKAEGKSKIASRDVHEAERDYSCERLQSLQDEWVADYPNVAAIAKKLFSNVPPRHKVADLVRDDVILDIATSTWPDRVDADPLLESALKAGNDPNAKLSFVREALRMLYRVGVVALKYGSQSGLEWYREGTRLMPVDGIDVHTAVAVHPMFWVAIGVGREPT